MLSTINEIFLLGVEALTKKVPIVLRFYSGHLRILTHRTKATCLISGNTAKIGTRPITFNHSAIKKTIDSVTIAFDYPFLERIESSSEVAPFYVGLRGTITLIPHEGQLLILSSDSPQITDQ